MTPDFNLLERRAADFFEQGDFLQALRIYLHMADGDNSLDAGYLGVRICDCYERLGDRHAAKYWYGRAVEENPTIEKYLSARNRLQGVGIDDLLK
jgi:hypothetical protein